MVSSAVASSAQLWGSQRDKQIGLNGLNGCVVLCVLDWSRSILYVPTARYIYTTQSKKNIFPIILISFK